ncbi:MAG: leucyl/phenylalanyl-tRNA--protein transferase [Acetobacteraceae bacterium]|jgi:leucyl/phenylalanyl-tRNA--protein transferase|nr:leucyl/phenylalanyl-tRNA--protein transferase [Acetobacteraceae bacterium]
MARRGAGETTVTPDLVLRAYRAGLFPMAERRDADRLYWLDPDRRGIQPLDAFHLPRRLARTVLSNTFEVRCDTAFAEVLAGCAAATEDRPETWINPDIERLFGALHDMGYAHSVECWQGGQLVGGLYGVALGGAFFGESMFSRVRDASKVALVHLVARLRLGGFALLDTQFVTDHLARFGAIEVPRLEYRRLLAEAVDLPAVFHATITPAQLRAELARMRAER